VKLVTPKEITEEEFNAFIDEFKDSGEELVPYSLNPRGRNFQEYITSLCDEGMGKGISDTWVPASTYFLVDETSKIYGAVNIRHRLTEKLKVLGGHIGYGIRPSMRKKGYGTRILTLALEKIKELGVNKVLITCAKDNVGSALIIRNNGGKLDSEVEIDNIIRQRYWITLYP
jgi:predicted acetyltransferase